MAIRKKMMEGHRVASVSPPVGLTVSLFGVPLLWPLDIAARLEVPVAGSMLVGSLTNWLVVVSSDPIRSLRSRLTLPFVEAVGGD